MTLDLLLKETELRVAKEAEARGEARGRAEGEAQGRAEGLQLSSAVVQAYNKGKSVNDISKAQNVDISKVKEILQLFGMY